MDNKCIRGALNTVAREKCKRGFKIDSDDEKAFNDALEIISGKISEQYSTPVRTRVLDNKTNEPYNLPEASRGYAHKKYENKCTANVQGDVDGSVKGIPASVSAECDASCIKRGEEGQQWGKRNQRLPPQTRIEESCDRRTTVSYITYACQADLLIRVYNLKHVKDGAAAAGAVGGATGVAAGATGGAVIGAAAGTVVPVAGNIIGGVLGGIIGGVVGGVLGVGVIGGGGAAIGAGVGAAVSNDNYVTVTAREVFEKLPEFDVSKDGKKVYCKLPVSTDSLVNTTTLF